MVIYRMAVSIYIFFAQNSNMDQIYKKPKTLYERFVNAYCQYEKRFCSREDFVRGKEMKSSEAEVNAFISKAPKGKKLINLD